MIDRHDALEAQIGDYVFCCRTEGKSPRTVGWYTQKLRYFADYVRAHGGPIGVTQIEPRHIRAFIRHLQTEVKAGENNPYRPTESRALTPQTVAGYTRTLRAFFSWAVREGLIDDSPMRRIKTPRTPVLAMRTFTDDEIDRLLATVKGSTPTARRNYTMLLVLLDTGVRVSELVGLEMGRLHLDLSYFTVMGKGAKERTVPLGRSSRRALQEYVRRFRPEPAHPTLDRVLLTEAGEPLRTGYVYRILSRACRQAGIEGKRVGPHTCRHTFARNSLMNGGDLLTLQRILGHASLEIVKLYVNLQTEDLLAQQWKYSPMDAFRAKAAASR